MSAKMKAFEEEEYFKQKRHEAEMARKVEEQRLEYEHELRMGGAEEAEAGLGVMGLRYLTALFPGNWYGGRYLGVLIAAVAGYGFFSCKGGGFYVREMGCYCSLRLASFHTDVQDFRGWHCGLLYITTGLRGDLAC